MKNKVIQGVVKEVATMQGSGIVDGMGRGVALQTKAGGFILTKSGLRIKVK